MTVQYRVLEPSKSSPRTCYSPPNSAIPEKTRRLSNTDSGSDSIPSPSLGHAGSGTHPQIASRRRPQKTQPSPTSSELPFLAEDVGSISRPYRGDFLPPRRCRPEGTRWGPTRIVGGVGREARPHKLEDRTKPRAPLGRTHVALRAATTSFPSPPLARETAAPPVPL